MSDSTTTAGKIVWFEMPAADSESACAFYGGLFWWVFEPFGGPDYQMSYQAGGAVYTDPATNGITVYIEVDDLDTAAARVRELGGSAGERKEIPGTGSYAVCQDPDSNRFGLFQAIAG
jgi:uncharacterized protein